MSQGPPKPPDLSALAALGLEVEDPSPKWDPAEDAPLIPRYLPTNRFHLLGASPHTGKSTLIAQLAHSLTTAEDFFGLPVNKKPVRFIFTDRCLESNLPALRRAGVDDLPMLSLVNTPSLLKFEKDRLASPLGAVLLLEQALKEVGAKPGDVIISDVHTNAFAGNIFDHRKTGAVMRHTGALCLHERLTLIGTCYGVKITKDPSTAYARLVDRIMGAAPLRGSADTLMYLTHPEEYDPTGKVLQRFEIASRQAPLWHVDLINRAGVFEAETTEEAMARVAAGPDAEKTTRKCEGVLPFVPFEETAFKAICEAYEAASGKAVAHGTVNGWLSQLAELGEVEKVKYGVWRRRES